MTIVVDTRADLDLANAEQAGWGGVPVAFSATAKTRMQASRAGFLRLIDDPDVVVYGVTSGYGQAAQLRFDGDERRRHAERPPRQSMASFGPALPERVTRLIVFARLANYIEGHAAITPALAESVAAMLARDALPHVPAEGHGGAGEIIALSHLFTPLAQASELGEKDTLALINGSPCAAATTADAAIAARRRLAPIEEIFALAFAAFGAPREHLDPALAALWGDDDEAAALASLSARVAGGDDTARDHQAPVSFRILPRMLGRLRRALGEAESAAGTALGAVTDNPVYVGPDGDHPDGRVLANGGYHNTRGWPAMDELAATYADLCTLAERLAAKILHGPVSQLPNQLQTQRLDARYFGCMPMAQVGFAEAARRAAARTFLPGSESGGFGQNDVAAPHFFAWNAQAEAARLLESALAPLAIIASQAFYVSERSVPPGLVERLAWVRRQAPVQRDTMDPPGPNAEAVAEALRAEVFEQVAAQQCSDRADASG